jgi:hypothetical protein
MKQYVIDQLRPGDYGRLKEYLDGAFGDSGVEDLYWVPLDPGLLGPEQARHTDCHPLCFAVELMDDRISCELLVRTRNRMRCSCIDYATREQRDWFIDAMDAILERLEISV